MPNDIGGKNHNHIQGRIAYGMVGSDAYAFRASTSDVSSSAAILSVSDVPSKTVETELITARSVAASAQIASSVLSLTGVKKVTLFIDHGRANTVAFGTNGTEYRVEVGQDSGALNKWRGIASVVAGSAACLAVAASADVAAGNTDITVTSGTSIPSRGDIVFWANTVTAANSEWIRVRSVSGTASFTSENGLDYDQDSDTNIFTQAEQFVLAMGVESFTRLRVRVNNNASGTTQAVYSRVAAITER